VHGHSGDGTEDADKFEHRQLRCRKLRGVHELESPTGHGNDVAHAGIDSPTNGSDAFSG
jgi:hypothetical protein